MINRYRPRVVLILILILIFKIAEHSIVAKCNCFNLLQMVEIVGGGGP